MGDALMAACGVRDVYRRQGTNAVATMVMFDHLFNALSIHRDRCGGYPASLENLERPAGAAPNSCRASASFALAVEDEGTYRPNDELGMFEFSVGRLQELRRSNTYHEYRIQYCPQGRRGDGTFDSYALSADPVERGETGFSSFWLSDAGELRENRDGVAGPSSVRLRTLSARRRTMP